MSSFASSFRDAVRSLRRRPGFAAVAIATIALAVGANTAIWSVVSGALLRPLPFRGPERLVSLDVRSYTGHLVSLSVPNYRDWRDRNRVFESFAASAGWTLRLTGRGQAQILNGRALLGDVFGLLGLTPAAGRLFTPVELGDRPSGDRLVVLGRSSTAWSTIAISSISGATATGCASMASSVPSSSTAATPHATPRQAPSPGAGGPDALRLVPHRLCNFSR